jgi:hypothetical protein
VRPDEKPRHLVDCIQHLPASGGSVTIVSGNSPERSMRAIFGLILAGAVYVSTGSAHAQTIHPVELDGETVNFVVPDGYCVLDKNRPIERMAFDLVDQSLAGRSRLILYFTACHVLQAFREDIQNAPEFDPFGVYFVPIYENGSFKKETRLSRSEFAAEMFTAFPTVDVESAMEETVAQSKEILADPTADLDVEYFGATEYDKDAVYLSFRGIGTTFGESARVFGEGNATLIHQRAIATMLYSLENGAASRAELLQDSRSLLAELLDANPDSDN